MWGCPAAGSSVHHGEDDLTDSVGTVGADHFVPTVGGRVRRLGADLARLLLRIWTQGVLGSQRRLASRIRHLNIRPKLGGTDQPNLTHHSNKQQFLGKYYITEDNSYK